MYNLKLVCGESAKINELPDGAVSLDGYVQGPSLGSNDEKDRWSFDHHAGCIRLFTQATCEQVRTALCLGFSFEGRDVYVNDIDGDTLLSLWLINNPEKCNHDRVRSLVRAVGAVDSHGPTGNLTLSTQENKLADEFFHGAIQPLSKLEGKPHEHFDKWEQVIADCLKGISLLVDGASLKTLMQSEAINIVCETTVGPHKMAMGTCDGFGFMHLYKMGYDIGILYKEAANGTITYTVAKKSDLVRYPLGPGDNPDSLLGRLSKLEPGWGGGSSIGGSPRKANGESSTLKPGEVWKVATKQ